MTRYTLRYFDGPETVIGTTPISGPLPDIGHEIHLEDKRFRVLGVEHVATQQIGVYAVKVIVVVEDVK